MFLYYIHCQLPLHYCSISVLILCLQISRYGARNIIDAIFSVCCYCCGPREGQFYWKSRYEIKSYQLHHPTYGACHSREGHVYISRCTLGLTLHVCISPTSLALTRGWTGREGVRLVGCQASASRLHTPNLSCAAFSALH